MMIHAIFLVTLLGLTASFPAQNGAESRNEEVESENTRKIIGQRYSFKLLILLKSRRDNLSNKSKAI